MLSSGNPRMNEIEFHSVDEIISEPDKYRNDHDYLNAMCEHFGCHLSRDIIAVTVSSHTNLELFTANEWDQFVALFGRVIAQFLAAEETIYGRPH